MFKKVLENSDNLIFLYFSCVDSKEFCVAVHDLLACTRSAMLSLPHTSKLTDSITSRKTSFLRYLTPSPLHETAFVNATGGLGAPTSSLCPS